MFALLLPLSRDQNRGEGERGVGGPRVSAATVGRGKREREVRRPDPRLQPGRRRIKAAWPQGPAGGGRRRCGGGLAGWGGGLAAVGEVLGVEVARFPSLP